MSESTCPSCGAPIDHSKAVCQFCGRSIISVKKTGDSSQLAQKGDVSVDAQFGHAENSLQSPQKILMSERVDSHHISQSSSRRNRHMRMIGPIIFLFFVGFILYQWVSQSHNDFRNKEDSVTQSSKTEKSEQVVVLTGVNDDNTEISIDANALYMAMKQKAALSNKRYARAWRQIPSEIRSSLQQSIRDLPKQVDAKCQSLSRQYMSTQQDLERRAIYLKCSMEHQDRLSAAIESYAKDYANGEAGDFQTYVSPDELLNMRWIYQNSR